MPQFLTAAGPSHPCTACILLPLEKPYCLLCPCMSSQCMMLGLGRALGGSARHPATYPPSCQPVPASFECAPGAAAQRSQLRGTLPAPCMPAASTQHAPVAAWSSFNSPNTHNHCPSCDHCSHAPHQLSALLPTTGTWGPPGEPPPPSASSVAPIITVRIACTCLVCLLLSGRCLLRRAPRGLCHLRAHLLVCFERGAHAGGGACGAHLFICIASDRGGVSECLE
mmetsp:Transcript_156/g.348  ORF Transcript_156/g.348 Transcript_156/m.348 type:complete len:225 (+) Transcript_156:103-777(+)